MGACGVLAQGRPTVTPTPSFPPLGWCGSFVLTREAVRTGRCYAWTTESSLSWQWRWPQHPAVLLVEVMILAAVGKWGCTKGCSSLRLACYVATLVPPCFKHLWLGFYRAWRLDISSHLNAVSVGNTYIRKNCVVSHIFNLNKVFYFLHNFSESLICYCAYWWRV